ncbi:hypothetical protein BJ741DRAFT_628704 [Chytriomyces cf. hyalinus JEL632]|nr:hypothetical protein BJ741DRAFT_628704 [Chytriomyces cf. hyalinus JEL632]
MDRRPISPRTKSKDSVSSADDSERRYDPSRATKASPVSSADRSRFPSSSIRPTQERAPSRLSQAIPASIELEESDPDLQLGNMNQSRKIQRTLDRSWGSDDGSDNDDWDGPEENEFKNTSTIERVQNIIFSVLFSMAHGNNAGMLIEYGSSIIEDLQLLTFLLDKEMAELYFIPTAISSVASIDYLEMEFSVYSTIFYIAAASVLLLMINMFFVAIGIMRSKQASLLPIKMLRFLATVLPTVFYIPIFEILISPLICNRILHPEENSPILLANIACSDPRRWPLVTISAIALILYVPTGLSLAAVFFDTNPTLKGVANRVHGRTDIIYLITKTGIILAYKLLDHHFYMFKIVLVLAASVSMYAVVLYYFPYYSKEVNQMRAGFYFGTACMSLVSIGAAIAHDITHEQRGQEVLIIMAVTLICGFGFGFYVAGQVYSWVQKRAQGFLEMYRDPSNRSKLIIPKLSTEKEPVFFLLWPHVEISVRYITHYMDERSKNFDSNQISDLICLFRRGIKEFPKSPFPRICFGNYYFQLTGEKQIPLRQFLRLANTPVSYDIAFQIYFNKQIVNQRKEKKILGLGSILNLANFAELQKTDLDAKINHYLGIQEARNMWKLLLRHDYRMDDLLAVTNKIYTYSRLAEENYLKLINKHPKSLVLLRYYARFCHDVMGDNIKARELTERAAAIETKFRSTEEMEPEEPNFMLQRFKTVNKSKASSIGATQGSKVHSPSSQRKRLKKVERYGQLLGTVIGLTIVVIITIAVVTYSLISNLLGDLNSFSANIRRMHSIEFQIAMEFRRVRQIQRAHEAGDRQLFDNRRDLLFNEMLNFSTVSEEFFLKRDKSSAAIESWFTDAKIETHISHYPVVTSGFLTRNLTFHDYTENFIISGLTISNTSFDGFSNSAFRNDVRFVLDNGLSSANVVLDPLINDGIIPTLNNKTNSAIILIYVLTASEIFVIALGLFLKDLVSVHLTSSQKESLEILGEIPKQAVENIVDDLEDADCEDIFPDHIVQAPERFKTSMTPVIATVLYHLQSKGFCFCAIVLAIIMAYLNLTNINVVGQNFGIYNSAGDVTKSLVRAFNRASEVLYFDPQTQGTREKIVSQLAQKIATLESAIYRIQYGDIHYNPPTSSYETFPQELYFPLVQESCVAYDKAMCLGEYRHWNESIGYTEALVNQGLLKMTQTFKNVVIDLATAGDFSINFENGEKCVKLLDQLLEPDLTEGWLSFENAVVHITDHLVRSANTATLIIFILQVIFLTIAFVMQRMYLSWREARFRFTEVRIFNSINRLPKEVKSIAIIAKYLETAEDGRRRKQRSSVIDDVDDNNLKVHKSDKAKTATLRRQEMDEPLTDIKVSSL